MGKLLVGCILIAALLAALPTRLRSACGEDCDDQYESDTEDCQSEYGDDPASHSDALTTCLHKAQNDYQKCKDACGKQDSN